MAVSEYGCELLDESEQAFGERIIALIEFIKLVSITDNPFGLYFIFHFHFIVIPLLVEPPVVSLHTHINGCCKEGRSCRYI